MTEEKRPAIEIRPGGPLLVRGVPVLETADGVVTSPKPVFALCRCGKSAEMPFCDGSHARNGFSGECVTSKAEIGSGSDSGAMAVADWRPDSSKPARVRIRKNGPALVEGPVALTAETPIEPATREPYALCRCGQSKIRPYCDGTHRDIDFVG